MMSQETKQDLQMKFIASLMELKEEQKDVDSKKWNTKAIYSAIYLGLSVATFFGGLELVSWRVVANIHIIPSLDQFVSSIIAHRWGHVSLWLFYYTPIVLGAVLLVLATYLGFRSLGKEYFDCRGRFVGLLSTSLALFACIISFISFWLI